MTRFGPCNRTASSGNECSLHCIYNRCKDARGCNGRARTRVCVRVSSISISNGTPVHSSMQVYRPVYDGTMRIAVWRCYEQAWFDMSPSNNQVWGEAVDRALVLERLDRCAMNLRSKLLFSKSRITNRPKIKLPLRKQRHNFRFAIFVVNKPR